MSHKALRTPDTPRAEGAPPPGELALEQVKIAVQGIRYGEVRVVIQDGVIVQIERVEKQRLR